jgi:hypothetical protein
MVCFGLSTIYSQEKVDSKYLKGKNVFTFFEEGSELMYNYDGETIDALISWFTRKKHNEKTLVYQYFLRGNRENLSIDRLCLDKNLFSEILYIPKTFKKGNPIISIAYKKSKSNNYHDIFSISRFSKELFNFVENTKRNKKTLRRLINENKYSIFELNEKIEQRRDDIFINYIKNITMIIICYLIYLVIETSKRI